MGADGYTVQVVADYGPAGDVAWSEVAAGLRAEGDRVSAVSENPVPAFNTVATGYVIEQLARHGPDADRIVYGNTAPRTDDATPRDDNAGEPLTLGIPADGAPVAATDAGYAFSFVRNDLEALYALDIDDAGSQFRSRDQFPAAVTDIAEGRAEQWIAAERDVASIPAPPDSAVGYVDGYGNVKTTVRDSDVDLAPGTPVELAVDGDTVTARYVDGIFGVEPDEYAFAPGSWGGEDPYLEIVERGGDAAAALGDPVPGADLDWAATNC